MLAIKYKDGIMMAADTLGEYHSPFCHTQAIMLKILRFFIASYGSLARFKDVQRLHAVGSYTVIGAGGDMSDFQYLQGHLEDLTIAEEDTAADGHKLGPAEIHEYLSQVMYRRRSKMNPLWNSLLVGGFKDGERCVLCSGCYGPTV